MRGFFMPGTTLKDSKMSEEQQEQTAEDFTEATEAAEEALETEGQAETTEDEAELEETYYEIGELKASEQELKDWKEAYETKKSKDADYTQKTQTLSAEKKALTEKQTALDQKLEMLGSLEGDIEALTLGDLKDVDLDKVLAEEGTDEYLRVQREIEKRKSSVKGLTEKFNDVQKQYYAEAYTALSDSLGWDDDAKRQADTTAIQGYVKDSGITEKEFSKVTSPKVMTAILEAAKYRDLMNRKVETTKKVQQAPKTSKPSTNTTKTPMQPWERMYGKD